MGKDLKGKNLGRGFNQRKDGRYMARATINGTNITLYDMNLSNLKKRFDKEKTKLSYQDNNTTPNITFAEWYEEWFKKCKAPQLKNPVSRKVYDRKVKNTYCNILGDKKIRDISQMNIQEATNELTDKYTTRYIKETLSVVRECFDIAVINHITSVNPCTSINVKDDNMAKHEKRILDHWEQELFIEEIKHDYYYEAYMILLLTGMRIGEFSGLQWNDVDFCNKCIHINKSMSTSYIDGVKTEELTSPKTSNSYRDIPFFDNVEDLFKSWKVKQDMYKRKLGDRWRCNPSYGDLVFTSTMGSPVTRYVLVHDLNKVVNNINLKEQQRAITEIRTPREIKHMHPHCFRHTFATRCFENNLDPIFVQSIMGHANYATTVSYTHILNKTRQQQISKVKNFLNNNCVQNKIV